MIFNSKRTYPSPGDCRTVTKFALFPRRCEKNHYHWLEFVDIFQRWVYGNGWHSIGTHNANLFPCKCNQEKKQSKGLELGEVYVCKNTNKNPFKESLYYVRIIAISGEYVQYNFVEKDGSSGCSCPIKWDNDIKSFNICYIRYNKKENV